VFDGESTELQHVCDLFFLCRFVGVKKAAIAGQACGRRGCYGAFLDYFFFFLFV